MLGRRTIWRGVGAGALLGIVALAGCARAPLPVQTARDVAGPFPLVDLDRPQVVEAPPPKVTRRYRIVEPFDEEELAQERDWKDFPVRVRARTRVIAHGVSAARVVDVDVGYSVDPIASGVATLRPRPPERPPARADAPSRPPPLPGIIPGAGRKIPSLGFLEQRPAYGRPHVTGTTANARSPATRGHRTTRSTRAKRTPP